MRYLPIGGGGGGAPGAPNNGGGGAGTGGGGKLAGGIMEDGSDGGNGWTICAPMLCRLDIFASSGIDDPTCFTMSSSRIRFTDSKFSCELEKEVGLSTHVG